MVARTKDAGALACLTVDLDPLWAYQRIHGLQETRDTDMTITTLALRRFSSLADQLGIPVTFFLVTSDMETPSCRREVAALSDQGHELANHTSDHLYDLLAINDDRMVEQVEKGQQAIAEITGASPTGFRAPGYGMTKRLAHFLHQAGYSYDSSLLPSPPYYAAKAAVMAAMRLAGRKSRAHLHRISTVLGPTTPYRMDLDHPWKRGTSALIEFPVTVLPGLRIPYIATTLSLAGPTLAEYLTAMAARLHFVTIECHGIDLLDVSDLPASGKAVADHQPDLAVPWRTKRFILARAVQLLLDSHEFITLDEATRRLRRR